MLGAAEEERYDEAFGLVDKSVVVDGVVAPLVEQIEDDKLVGMVMMMPELQGGGTHEGVTVLENNNDNQHVVFEQQQEPLRENQEEEDEEEEKEGSTTEEKVRKDLRRERNREHARISRERKRRKVETLTEENDTLQRQRMHALEECCRLRDALARSEHENARLQAWINQMHYMSASRGLEPSETPPVDSVVTDDLQQAPQVQDQQYHHQFADQQYQPPPPQDNTFYRPSVLQHGAVA